MPPGVARRALVQHAPGKDAGMIAGLRDHLAHLLLREREHLRI